MTSTTDGILGFLTNLFGALLFAVDQLMARIS